MPRYMEIMQCCQCPELVMGSYTSEVVCKMKHQVIEYVNGEDFPTWCPLKKKEELH